MISIVNKLEDKYFLQSCSRDCVVEGTTVLLSMLLTLSSFTTQIRTEDSEKVHFFKYFVELVDNT